MSYALQTVGFGAAIEDARERDRLEAESKPYVYQSTKGTWRVVYGYDEDVPYVNWRAAVNAANRVGRRRLERLNGVRDEFD